MLLDLQTHLQQTLHLGDHVGSWRLTTIERSGVLFTSPEGSEARLEFDGDTLQAVVAAHQISGAGLALTPEMVERASLAVTVVSEQERVVDRHQLVEATQGHPLQLLSQIRFVPHREGPVSGLQVAALAAYSPWTQKVGLKVDDVVTAINGKPVLDLHQLTAITNDLLNAPNVDLTVQRAGQEVRLQYQMMESSSYVPLGQGNP